MHIIAVEEIITPELDESRRVQILKDFFTHWLQQQITNLEIVAELSQNDNSSSELPRPA